MVAAAMSAILLPGSCGRADDPGAENASREPGVIEAVEALNGIAAPPVPTETIHDARDAAAAANAHIGTVDSILGSR